MSGDARLHIQLPRLAAGEPSAGLCRQTNRRREFQPEQPVPVPTPIDADLSPKLLWRYVWTAVDQYTALCTALWRLVRLSLPVTNRTVSDGV